MLYPFSVYVVKINESVVSRLNGLVNPGIEKTN